MVETSRYAALFVSYLRNELSVKQSSELEEFLEASPGNRRLFEAVTDTDKLLAGLKARFLVNLLTIESRLDTLTDIQTEEKRVPGVVRRMTVFAAALALLILAGIYGWPLIRNDRYDERESIKGSEQKLLGENRAILTLPDGHMLQLDALSDGKIQNDHYPVSKKDSNTIVFGQAAKNLGGYYRLAVPAGANFRAVLPDGTSVFLDAMSTIHFPATWSQNNRRLSLLGHACFDVAGNGRYPFVVSSPHLDIQVLGTRFDIMDYTNETYQRTVLVKGKIKVIHQTDTTLLLPAQELSINKGRPAVNKLTSTQVENALSWQKGFFNFDGMDIYSAAFRLAKWYRKEVVFSKDLSATSLGKGNFQRDLPLPVLLQDLETRGLHFDLVNDTIILKK